MAVYKSICTIEILAGILLLFLQQTALALPTIEQGVVLVNLTKITNPGNQLTYLTGIIPVAYDPSTTKSTQLSVVPDISESRFISGLKPDVDFGITCKAGSPPCTIPNNPVHNQEVYRQMGFYSVKGNTNSWWNSGSPSSSEQALTLVADLDTSVYSKDWIYGGNSVLGLSPSSEYLRYLSTAYKLDEEESNIFSLYLSLDDINGRYDPKKNSTYSESFLTLNGYQADHVYQLEPIIWTKVDDNPNLWSFSGFQTQIGNMAELTSSVCISWTNDYYLLVESVDALLKAVNQEICGKDECNGEGKIENGPKITLKIDEIEGNPATLTIQPSSYIYLDSQDNQFKVSAANIKDYYSQDCSSGQNIGFARQFFLDFYLIYKTDSAGLRSIGIAEVIPDVVFTNQELVYIVMGSITGLMTLIYVLRFFYIAYQKNANGNKKGNEKEKDEGEYIAV